MIENLKKFKNFVLIQFYIFIILFNIRECGYHILNVYIYELFLKHYMKFKILFL